VTVRGSAVVTGAARGLGLAIAAELHAAGYAVYLTDVDGPSVRAAAERLGAQAAERIDASAAERPAQPVGPYAAELDVTDEAACRAVAARAAQAPGGLAVWVNNAGILATGPSWTHDAALRRRILEVNALGAMNGTLAALEHMRAAGRGHIVNIVSLAGLIAAPGETVYSASKHALLAFSLGTLSDLRAAGVRGVHISCVCPDGMWTPMLHDKLTDDGAAASFTGTLLRPERVARRVARIVERPRPVVSIPRWRGLQVRVLDTFPRLAAPAAGLILAYGRAQQRRRARRLPG